MRLAALLLLVANGTANAGEAWLACTPLDDPVNGRRVFQQEPCPPGERHTPLPPAPGQWPLQDTFPERSVTYSADSWAATGGGTSGAHGYRRTGRQRHAYRDSGRRW